MTPVRLYKQRVATNGFAVGTLEGADIRNVSPTHDRCVEASATLQNVRRHFPELGISRLGELTGLDTLGIPVAFATRPNSFSLSLSLGKGLDRESALTSAAMEAAEMAVAERRPDAAFSASLSALQDDGKTVLDLSRMARCQPHLLDPDVEIDCIEGFDLVSGETIVVPWSLVGLDHRIDPPGYQSAFEVATDGLASGNTVAEAVLHAIYELIERDAYSMFELMPPRPAENRHFTPVCSGKSALGDMLGRIEHAGLSIELVDMTSDIPMPAHLAILSGNSQLDGAELGADITFVGCGCHRDPVRSITRAITEAAQARAAFIAGARDDFHAAWRDDDAKPRISSGPASKQRSQLVDLNGAGMGRRLPADSIGEHIETVLSALQTVGVEQVVVVSLPAEQWGIRVVRVLIPDLQTPLHGERSQVTVRGLRHVTRKSS